MLMRYRESPDPVPPGMIPPGSENKIMHADFRVGETQLLASDGNCSGTPKLAGTSLALEAGDAAEARSCSKRWAKAARSRCR